MKIRLSGPTCSALALFLAMAGTVLAEPAGITLLGSGFTGTPFAITGDIVAESDSLYETIRDFSQPDAPTATSSTMSACTPYGSDSPSQVTLDQLEPYGALLQVLAPYATTIASPNGARGSGFENVSGPPARMNGWW